MPELAEIKAIEEEIRNLKAKLAQKVQALTPQAVNKTYTLKDFNGQNISFDHLFDGKDELIVVFNMGKSCAYCTLWADGFNGLTQPLEDRAAFVLISPDPPNIQKQLHASRKWNFNMLSYVESDIASDFGFNKNGNALPGIATFSKNTNNEIYFHYSTSFGPGDNFCNMWDIINILPMSEDWKPKFIY